jgi:hypothetical protein
MELTNFEVKQLNLFTDTLLVTGMSTEGKISLVTLKPKLRKIANEIAEFEKTTADSIRPENVEDLSDEDKAKLDKDYSDIIVPFYNTTVEIEFDLLSKEDFYKLVEHNNIEKLIGYEYIYTKLVNNE